jgi:hypothetical protein
MQTVAQGKNNRRFLPWPLSCNSMELINYILLLPRIGARLAKIAMRCGVVSQRPVGFQYIALRHN